MNPLARSAKDPAKILARARPIPVPGSGITLQPVRLGTVRAVPLEERNPELAAAVRRLQSALSSPAPGVPPTTSAPAPAPAKPVPAELLPKAPQLSPAQQRVLSRLQWGPSKRLTYRGDGEDATVRLLAAPALQFLQRSQSNQR